MLIIGLHPVGQVPDRALSVAKLAPQDYGTAIVEKASQTKPVVFFSYTRSFQLYFSASFRRGVVVDTAMITLDSPTDQRKSTGAQSDLETR
jgi:hypothetical protein